MSKLSLLGEESPWYSKGLKFKCTECGQCCTGAPGYIWVTEEEIQTIASHLKMTLDDFAFQHLRMVNGRWSLRERPTTYDCVFLNGKKCDIYMHRPTQCRTFPWWPQNLQSEEEWVQASEYCEGINHPEGEIVEIGKIHEQLSIQLHYEQS